MDILNEITKEVFEKNVPSAKMPDRNTSVFDRLKKMFALAYHDLLANIVAPAYEAGMEQDGELKDLCIRYVCLDAFIRTCRSLDLVLTATGFGIVSTDSTAPASRVRVDALVEELSVERLLVSDGITAKMIFAEGWGDTVQAQNQIMTLFYSPLLMKRMVTLPLTTANWQEAQGKAVTASTLLSGEISQEYRDELLHKMRTASLDNADLVVVQKCQQFMADYISRSPEGKPNRLMLQGIVEQLENYSASYPTYVSSRLYAKRHADRYQNRKEDPTFFFM